MASLTGFGIAARRGERTAVPADPRQRALTVAGIFRAHLLVIAALGGLHLGWVLLQFSVGKSWLTSLASLFNLELEHAIPTFVAASALLATAIVAGLVAASAERRLRWAWTFVALCILAMALDEGVGIHDRMAVRLQAMTGSSGIFFIGWLIPYLALVAVVGALLVPLALALPAATRNRLVVAAGLFVAAAMGMEMIEARMMSASVQPGATLDTVDFATVLLRPEMIAAVFVEEIGELLAVALALRALLLHLTEDLGFRGVTLLPRRKDPGRATRPG